MKIGGNRIRIGFNSPAVLGFTIACLLVQLLNMITGGASNRAVFSVYASSLADPLTYVRCIGHVLGHSGWEHLLNNLLYILILGPMLQEKYGTANMIKVFVITAVVTGIINMVFCPGVRLLGASGVVFAMILLSSVTAAQEHTIPATFILVAVLYIGREVWQGITSPDQISQLAHIVGGGVGSVLGFVLNSVGHRKA